jgi:arylsulfatase A-like enzyme
MKRRDFVGAAAVATAAGVAEAQQGAERREARYINGKQGAHPFRARPAGKRPHVFLICLDMVSPDQFLPSRRLRREMQLPALGRLAADGVSFHNAFCTVSICAPSRASLYTGRHPYVMANPGGGPAGTESILRATDVIYPEYLKATGYRTKHVGKNHIGAQKFMDAFDELDSNWNVHMPLIERDEGYQAFLRRSGIRMPSYSRQILARQPDRKSPRNQEYGGWIEQTGGKPFPLEGQYSHYLAQWAEQKVDAALEAGTAPVYLQLNIYDPHKPFTIPSGFEKREEHLRRVISLPDSYRQAAARDFRPAPGDPPLLEMFRRQWGFYEPERAKDFMVGNALAMEVADLAVNRFLETLKRRGIYDDSLIIYTADHGEMNCHLALVDKGCYIHPETQRVPLVIKPPAGFGPVNRAVDDPVSLLDIASTVCDFAGVEPLERMDGISLAPCLKGGALAAGRGLVFQSGWQITGNPACGTVERRPDGSSHMYVYNLASATDELYDMNDPDPQNLAHRPEHRETVAEMVRRMAGLIRSDARFGCYGNGFQMQHWGELNRAG